MARIQCHDDDLSAAELLLEDSHHLTRLVSGQLARHGDAQALEAGERASSSTDPREKYAPDPSADAEPLNEYGA